MRPADDAATAAVLALGLLGTAPVELPPAPCRSTGMAGCGRRCTAPDGAWLQGELVRRGLAVTAPAADVPEPALGGAARSGARGAGGRARRSGPAGGSGPWPAERVAARRGGYVLVRGGCGMSRGRRTSSISTSARTGGATSPFASRRGRRAGFAKAGLDLAALAGRSIVVRGFLFEANGPMIELAHPAADRGAGMRQSLLGLLVASLALALAACTPVRNPATGELQYTSLSPEEEQQLGRAGAPQGAGRSSAARYDDAGCRPMSSGSATG